MAGGEKIRGESDEDTGKGSKTRLKLRVSEKSQSQD